MGNNLIVDVSSINGAISKVNQLYAEATKSRLVQEKKQTGQ